MKHDFPDKIIFLDVDGVINIPPYATFNSDCVNNVKKIIEATGAKIVISSSWREGDLEKTKKHFPRWMHEYIIGETVCGYHYTVKGSSLPIVRGNEIKHWVDRNLKYPWYEDPSALELYKIYDENNNFRRMNLNKVNEDYSYVILDDDSDMLYEQRNHFIQTNGYIGLTSDDVKRAVAILNYKKLI